MSRNDEIEACLGEMTGDARAVLASIIDTGVYVGPIDYLTCLLMREQPQRSILDDQSLWTTQHVRAPGIAPRFPSPTALTVGLGL
ncbi:hypothetical protein ACFWWS_36505 [Streptomyces sp. NPDC059083]|uniref:hypothetical protein n=1 Tax=Streptomyces sp. NPDC059083 TaxID=3346721 RepID=UPI00367B3CB4